MAANDRWQMIPHYLRYVLARKVGLLKNWHNRYTGIKTIPPYDADVIRFKVPPTPQGFRNAV
jgi:hypothetical protein